MVEVVPRVPSGIFGLDSKIQGGFVKGSVNFVTGKTGTGKTSFCSSFLYAGSIRGEKGIYFTTEETTEDIKKDIKAMFDWNIDTLVEKKLLKFISNRPELPSGRTDSEEIARVVKLYVYDLTSKIEDYVQQFKAQRLVVDSVSLVELFIKDDFLKKVALMQLIDKIKELGVTAVITGTIAEGSEQLSASGLVEFIADSVIKLDLLPVVEEYKRTLTIRKMRRTDHSIMIHPFDIRRSGMKVIEVK